MTEHKDVTMYTTNNDLQSQIRSGLVSIYASPSPPLGDIKIKCHLLGDSLNEATVILCQADTKNTSFHVIMPGEVQRTSDKLLAIAKITQDFLQKLGRVRSIKIDLSLEHKEQPVKKEYLHSEKNIGKKYFSNFDKEKLSPDIFKIHQLVEENIAKARHLETIRIVNHYASNGVGFQLKLGFSGSSGIDPLSIKNRDEIRETIKYLNHIVKRDNLIPQDLNILGLMDAEVEKGLKNFNLPKKISGKFLSSSCYKTVDISIKNKGKAEGGPEFRVTIHEPKFSMFVDKMQNTPDESSKLEHNYLVRMALERKSKMQQKPGPRTKTLEKIALKDSLEESLNKLKEEIKKLPDSIDPKFEFTVTENENSAHKELSFSYRTKIVDKKAEPKDTDKADKPASEHNSFVVNFHMDVRKSEIIKHLHDLIIKNHTKLCFVTMGELQRNEITGQDSNRTFFR